MRELEREREYLEAAYDRVVALRGRAVGLARGADGEGDALEPEALFERDTAVRHAGRRLASLHVTRERLAVGRLDLDDGERRYIGRLAVAGTDGEPLIIDWRAPAAEAFYRALPRDRMGVVRRRHFRWRGETLVGLDDEVLDTEGARRTGLDLVGEAALIAALDAPRTGRMIDVVGTIQAEQDRIIRRPRPGVLVVQGGAGTGKTAVALHRAAYLLYADSQSFRDHAVLFVGPNATFLRYVEEVVPSLGEDRVVLATPAELGPDVAHGGTDSDAAARVKGDPRMVELLARTVRARQRGVREEVVIPCGRFRLRLHPDEVRDIVRRARRARGTHNARRAPVERAVLRLLERAHREALDRDVRVGRITPHDDDHEPRPVLDMVDRDAVRDLVHRVWPLLTPERLLAALYRSEARLDRAGRDLFTGDELAALHRPEGSDHWTVADVALLDELDALLGPVPGRVGGARRVDTVGPMVERLLGDRIPDCPRCGMALTYRTGSTPGRDRLECSEARGCDATFRAGDLLGDNGAQLLRSMHDDLTAQWTEHDREPVRPGTARFAHVIVDEAQDLSAMQWRSIARRCPSLSLTVAGDQAQAILPGSAGGWDEAVAALGAGGCEVAELTVNYRTPLEVMALADPVRLAASPDLSTARPVRSAGARPLVVRAEGAVTAALVVDAVRRQREALADGLLAVIGAGPVVEGPADDALAGLGVERLTVVQAKGLEFDGVVLVDPREVAGPDPALAARRLYVALTRTTKLLTVLVPGPASERLDDASLVLALATR